MNAKFDSRMFVFVIVSSVFMHLLYIVTVCKINLNDVLKERCLVPLQNVKSHDAFANDVKIK